MDEIALPIRVGNNRPDWAHIQKAALYRRERPEDRARARENQDGYSPNTIATEIAGLVCVAESRGATASAKADTYLATADDWQRRSRQ
jgi:glucoamylase